MECLAGMHFWMYYVSRRITAYYKPVLLVCAARNTRNAWTWARIFGMRAIGEERKGLKRLTWLRGRRQAESYKRGKCQAAGGGFPYKNILQFEFNFENITLYFLAYIQCTQWIHNELSFVTLHEVKQN